MTKQSKKSRAKLCALLVLALLALPVNSSASVSESEIEKAKAERLALQRELDRTVAAYQKATHALEETEAKAARAKQRLAESVARLNASRSRLNARANTMYRRGNVSFLQILLETRSLSEFERKMTLLEASATRDSSDMIRAARARADVDEEQHNLDAARAQQKRLVKRLTAETRDLTGRFSQARSVEEKLRSDRNTEIQLQAQARARTAKAVTELRRRAARSPSTTVIPFNPRGALRCMIDGPRSFTDTYGAPRPGGRTHKGVDIFAARGTPVLAIVDGVISKNSSSRGGLSVYLKGDNGTTYFYAHLSSYSDVSSGQKVAAGTRLGSVGNTGASWAAPHLHFEVQPRGGAAINPYPTAKAACG